MKDGIVDSEYGLGRRGFQAYIAIAELLFWRYGIPKLSY